MMNEVRSIQYLRAIAALMVVFVHYEAPLVRLGYDGWLPKVFGSGVDIFFVISGVVMWLSTADRGLTPREFLLKRFLRIAPMYVLITLFIALVMLTFPWAVNNGQFNAPHLAASLMFFPWEHPALTGHLYPVFVPGWTINAEMFFYLVFGAALLLGTRMRIPFVAVVFGLLIVAGEVLPITGSLSFYTRPYILEFLFGLVIAQMFLSGGRIGVPRALGLLLVGLGGLTLSMIFEAHLDGVDRFFIWGIPAAFIVSGFMYLEREDVLPRSRIMHFLGDASYSIYMTHTIVLSACGLIISRMPLPQIGQQLAYLPFAMAAVVAAGCVTYLLVEKPMTNALRPLVRVSRNRRQLA